MTNTDVKVSHREIAGEDLQWKLASFHEVRADTNELKAEINELKEEIKDLRYEMQAMRLELCGEIQALRKEMHRQLYWIIGTMIAIASVIIALK